MAKTNEVPVDKYSTKSTMGEGKIRPFKAINKALKATKIFGILQTLSSDPVQKDDVTTTYKKGQ